MARKTLKAIDLPDTIGEAGLKVAWRPISEIKPYENNPRVISEAAAEKVANSIKNFGWQQPLVVDKLDVVIVGHTRLKAAERLGLDLVPVAVADLSPAKARAYRLADNRTHDETGWLNDRLIAELLEINAEGGVDLEQLTAFDRNELDALLKNAAPDLDQLGEKFGAHEDSAFWPKIDVRVPVHIKERFDTLMDKVSAEKELEEHDRFLLVLELAERAFGAGHVNEPRAGDKVEVKVPVNDSDEEDAAADDDWEQSKPRRKPGKARIAATA